MNKVILIGNLTRDPEYSTTTGGVAKCSFTLAVQRRFANADGVREADFIPVICWRQTAENCAKYLAKGRKAAVEGSVQTRSYDAQDGTKRYVTEVIADSVEFLSRANADPGPTPPPERPAPPTGQQMSMRDMQNQGYTEVDEDELPY